MVYNPYADTSVYLGTIQLPHVSSITPGQDWDQTELPIERGAVISDHRRKRPVTLSISGHVTGQIELVPSAAGAAVLGADVIRLRIQLLAETGQTFTVKWGRRTWPNMAIVGIEEENEAATQRDDMWTFTLQLKQSRVATSTTVTASAVDPGIADLTSSGADGGLQSGTTVGPDTAADVTGVIGGGV